MEQKKNKVVIDLRTPAEVKRAERDRALCEEYNALVRQQPTAKPYRLFGALAKRYSLSGYGVAKILQKRGAYTPNV